MNKINFLLLTGIIIGFVGLAGCGDDSGPVINPVDAVTDRFSKIWIVNLTDATSTVMFGTEERTDAYADFQLTINDDNTYSTVEISEIDPWPTTGTWQFTDPDDITDPNQNSFFITRGDGLLISVTLSNNDEVIELNFSYDQDIHEGERMMAVDGQWKFVLVAAP